mmetsp:Transcript_8948/g.19128  ORF Transcript_8948/g.19128 Transcript_8948/m.19128 type:complete len:129 (+) Transcript_8948:100-486(+)|eukprot:CAMPEP_0202892842 /NCGR_PEP_ID=MMETSP1392-20130828/2524_1 /ASSEMBLY_ACC=CAM_ASM_000868 /TAXON_ID=225041 /ORGANISM="Chlamydomonas chlamydogama, Strain SAG 11-48b" /LENGTH=128 /DNA_ID=CAMNT_0049576949 /DNA_START=100 /DNA_END=486 /DNA_ORIENTATION=-
MAGDSFFDNFAQSGTADFEHVTSLVGKLLTSQAESVIKSEQDMTSAFTDYTKALQDIFSEQEVDVGQVFKLPDAHPLKNYFMASMDQPLFEDVMQQFIQQAGQQMENGHAWEAEAAVGEADGEDHTLE